MNEELLERCSLFYETRAVMDRAFRYTDCFTVSACAAQIAASGKQVTAEKLKELRRVFRKGTKPLSMLRAIAPSCVAVMAASDDAEAVTARIKAAYAALRKHFIAIEYTAIAALMLADAREEAEFAALAAAARAQFDAFKKLHRIRTDSTNIPLCMLLALRGADPAASAENAEACFKLMRSEHRFRCRWTLAQMLTLDPRDNAEKCTELCALKDKLRAEKKSFSMYYELAALACRSEELKEKAEDALAVFDTLSQDRRFNGWKLDNTERMIVAYLVAAPSSELFWLTLSLHYEKRSAQAAAAAA